MIATHIWCVCQTCISDCSIPNYILHEQALGESDIKFMRYSDLLGNLVVDSIDSDVLLISLLHVQQQRDNKHNVYVRRYKAVQPSTETVEKDAPKRKRESAPKQYEIIDIHELQRTMHICLLEAIGDEVMMEDDKKTFCLCVVFLLSGILSMSCCVVLQVHYTVTCV